MSNPVTASVSRTNKWGVTQVKIDKCTYTWTIRNFSYLRKRMGEALISPWFSTSSDEEPSWFLRLYSKGINDNYKDHLSLYLCQKSGAECKFEGQYALSVIDNKRDKFVEQREECYHNKNYSSWGFPDFLKSEVLKTEADRLLPDDCLTIHCEIAIVAGIGSFSSEDGQPVHQRQLPAAGAGPAPDYLEKLFLRERFSDVRLIGPCGKGLPAHKSVLAARSPVFEAMFAHDMLERKVNEVEVADVEHEVLREMLRFIYTARLEGAERLAAGLLSAADKYAIGGLREVCEAVLTESLSVDNVIQVLVVADRHNVTHLRTRAMNFIKAHVKEVINSEGFKTLAQVDILKSIIQAVGQQ